MTMHDFAIASCSLAGLIMVVGGIALIYKGAITLAATDSSTALSIEWKQDFRLNTQVPGLAFFIVGLMFSGISIISSKPSQVEPIEIRGQIIGVTQPITITALPSSSSWTIAAGSNGVVNGRIYPDADLFTLTISAPGYQPLLVTKSLTDSKNRVIVLDKPHPISLQQATSVIVGRQENILPAPDLPPLNSAPKFGVAQ